MSALMIACMFGHLNVVKILLSEYSRITNDDMQHSNMNRLNNHINLEFKN